MIDDGARRPSGAGGRPILTRWDPPLELTPEQIAAARARGCAFSLATEDQVRRLTMQRRIFRIGGEPFVAMREAGRFETHGTLAALVEGHRPGPPDQDRGAEAMPTAAPAAPGDTEAPAVTLGAPAPAEAEGAQAERDAPATTDAAAATPRKPKTPRRKPTPADADAASDGTTAVGPSEAEEMLAGIAAAQSDGPRARVVGRRRAGQPPPPRWMTAGKARRGRLK
jgi:hypothetical protein